MLLIAENIPATSETVPLIVIYLTTTMSLTSISIILTVLLSRLHNASNYAPVMSRTFYNFMTRKAAFMVGMSDTVKRYENQTKMYNNKVLKKKKLQDKKLIESVKKNERLNQEGDNRQERIQCKNNYQHFVISQNNLSHYRDDDLTKNIKKLRTEVKTLLSKDSEECNLVSNEWKLVALIVDRLLFWLFFIVTFSSSTFLLFILPVLKHKDII